MRDTIFKMIGHETLKTLSDWQLAPEIIFPTLFILIWYVKTIRTLRTDSKTPLSNEKYFYFGIASILAVVLSPIGTHATNLFWCHMLQHMVLMMISGPLLVLGLQGVVVLKNVIFLRLTNPVFIWISYASTMVGVHFTGLHNFLMNGIWMHRLVEVPLYIIVAYLFYYNLLDKKDKNRRISHALSVICLFLMMIPETLTGFFIYVSPTSLYDGMFTLTDQRIGGSLMWAGSMVIDAIWISMAVSAWLKSEEREGERINAEIASEKL